MSGDVRRVSKAVRPMLHNAISREGNRTGFVYDPIFLRHVMPGHPESAERLSAIVNKLACSGVLERLHAVPARKAQPGELALNHDPAYIRRVHAYSAEGGGLLDEDTYVTADSWDVACAAAGGCIDLALAVACGRLHNGFALVRPPGHHALAQRAMGFCIFNNIALAVRHVQAQTGLARLAIVDFDVHHGNGTQEAFERQPDILFISTHQHPFYPGTGVPMADNGHILNLPLPTGAGDAEMAQTYNEHIVPALDRFQPGMMLISAGYDAHWNDPLAGLNLTLTGFRRISTALYQTARRLCDGRIVFMLEGGYRHKVLARGVVETMRILLGDDLDLG